MRKIALSLSVALLTAVPALGIAEQPIIDLPNLGNPADNAISPADELKIGKQVAAELYRYDYVVEDDQLNEYLASIGWRLAAHGAPNPPPFNFLLIADPRINAFALPGGFIGVNAGTVLSAGTESELAGVMAHEEAHVTQRHAARAQNDDDVATTATWLAVLAAIIAGSANPNIVLGAISLGTGINYQRQVSYTRGNEFEADWIGIRTLAAAGFDPAGMSGFFSRLEVQTRLYGNQIPEILLTHPVNTTRIAEANERAARYPKRDIKDSMDFSLMRARIRVLMADSPNDAVAYFSGEVNGGRDTPDNRYGLAMSLLEQGQQAQALATIAPLAAANPRQITIQLLDGEILTAAGKRDEGLGVYSRALTGFPRFPPAIFAYSKALIDAGKPDEARQVLLGSDQALGKRIDTYRLLATAARAKGAVAEAQYQQALYWQARGDLRSALQQLNAGLRIASIAEVDRARLSAKRQELLDAIPREELKQLIRDGG